MVPFPLAVLLALILSFNFVSTLSDKEHEKLDEIEALLNRLKNEIDRMRHSDRHMITQRPSVRNSTDGDVTVAINNNNTETSDNRTNDEHDNIRNLTTLFESPTTQHTKTDSDATISVSTTKVFDSTAVSSDLSNSTNRIGLDLTTGPSQTAHSESVNSTGPSRPEVTEGVHHTTTGEEKDKDKDIKDKHKEGDKEKVEEENELREVENVRRLIDEGEGLERQLKGVFSELRSLSQCASNGEKCGVRHVTKCCQSLKCNDRWSGTCYPDCIPVGQSCRDNFFCCSGSQCVKSLDSKGEDKHVCKYV